jgi:hypothetical protein
MCKRSNGKCSQHPPVAIGLLVNKQVWPLSPLRSEAERWDISGEECAKLRVG